MRNARARLLKIGLPVLSVLTLLLLALGADKFFKCGMIP